MLQLKCKVSRASRYSDCLTCWLLDYRNRTFTLLVSREVLHLEEEIVGMGEVRGFVTVRATNWMSSGPNAIPIAMVELPEKTQESPHSNQITVNLDDITYRDSPVWEGVPKCQD